jgi:hypothetical protein
MEGKVAIESTIFFTASSAEDAGDMLAVPHLPARVASCFLSSPIAPNVPSNELAAWTMLTSMLLNLDEAITK